MQPKSNVLPFNAATRSKRLVAAKPTRLTSVCYKASDKAHTSVDWYTPPAIVRALGGRRGFDLDPCTPEDPSRLPAPTASRMIPPSQDGLATPWLKQAFVWMNPPYGKGIEKWLSKLANHPGGGRPGAGQHGDGMDARLRAFPPQRDGDPVHPWEAEVCASRRNHRHGSAVGIVGGDLRQACRRSPSASAGERCVAREVLAIQRVGQVATANQESSNG